MKALKDLKDEIIAKQFQKFYVFYGEDFGLRRHYIQEIKKSFNKIQVVDFASQISSSNTGKGLFKTKQIKIVYNDVEFAKLKADKIQDFIKRITDDCVILVYEEELENTTLFKEFNNHITHFPRVNTNIAEEFIDNEIKLSKQSKAELAKNCKNDYNLICLESDKIRSYASSKNISDQSAYDELNNQGQLVYEYEPFNIDELMDDVLKAEFHNLAYWSNIISKKYKDHFWIYLNAVFNNYLIAYLLVRYGRYEGSNRAYDYGLPWGRTKTLREYAIPYSADDLLESAYEIACLDEKVKSGKIQSDELFDRFLCTIL